MTPSSFFGLEESEESPGEAASIYAFGVVLPKVAEATPSSEASPCTGIPPQVAAP